MSRLDHFHKLCNVQPAVIPSMLLCDFGDLRGVVHELESIGVQAFHLDVMDGHFVPNFTYGMPIVQAFRKLSKLPLDVHLMISEPHRYVEAFFQAGADVITIHVEAYEKSADVADVLRKIRGLGAGAGLALNPNTSLDRAERLIDLCDLALVMSVPAGFGGQTFDHRALERLSRLRGVGRQGLMLEVDGGVNSQTIGPCAKAGAQLLVVGSALFRQAALQPAFAELTDLALRL